MKAPSNYTPERLTREIMRATHKIENGQCVKCGFIEISPKTGQLWPHAPEMFYEPCEAITALKAAMPYRNKPTPLPGELKEFNTKIPFQPCRLKMGYTKYLKVKAPRVYEFTTDKKKATVFLQLQELTEWKGHISRIWKTSVIIETV
jgi:hypothetical protein